MAEDKKGMPAKPEDLARPAPENADMPADGNLEAAGDAENHLGSCMSAGGRGAYPEAADPAPEEESAPEETCQSEDNCAPAANCQPAGKSAPAESGDKASQENGAPENVAPENVENPAADCSPENAGDEPENTGKAEDAEPPIAPSPFRSHENAHGGEAAEEAGDNAEKNMGLLDHLNELRGRLVKACIAVAVGFGICWAFVDPLFNALIEPLLAVLPEGAHAQYTTLPEAFFTRMYIAFVAAVFLASPVIFYQIWAFVAPGLYDEEKRYIVPIAVLSALFFVCGACFCYYVVFPFAFNFFVSYSTPDIVITPKISDYLSFVIKLLFAFGLIFEMPIFTLFLARLGIVTAAMMRRARKYAIVAIFILAAILTPPDVLSQLLMACPMLLLYEASIGVAVVFGRKKKPAVEEPNG